MPPLPAHLEADCEDPGVRVGQDARSALARNRAWGKCEKAKRKAGNKFYKDVRNSRPK